MKSTQKPHADDTDGAKPTSPRVYRPDDSPSTGDTARKPSIAGADQDGEKPKEIGGRKGPDPTRYGDWEKNGRCIDF